MGTYHWDRHIGCLPGIYYVRRQVLFCGYVSISGIGQTNNNLDGTRTFENHLQLRKPHHYVGILLGQFMLPPWDFQSQNSRSARCATCNERQTMNGHFSETFWDGHISLRRHGDLQTTNARRLGRIFCWSCWWSSPWENLRRVSSGIL